MTRMEFDKVQNTILQLMEDERGYCATYCKNNPGDVKRRETIRDYIVSGLQNALSSLHEQVKTGRISING